MKQLHYYAICAAMVFGGILQSCAPRPVIPAATAKQLYNIDSTLRHDTSLEALIQPYKKGVDTMMQVVVGSTDIPLTKAQPECTLGNFMADALLTEARKLDPKVEFAVANYGGIRVPYVEPGNITKGKIYEIMPFDNTIAIADLSGETVQQFCNHIAAAKGWPVSGLTFRIKDKTAVDIMINGIPLNTARFYKAAIPDYIARGGDNCSFLADKKKKYTSVFVRDAMLYYLRSFHSQAKPLHPEIQNRISYAE